MGQLTIYIDDETERRIKMGARNAKISVSKWVAMVVRDRTENLWPKDVSALAGTWPDFPSADFLRKNYGKDRKRETF